MVYMGERMVGRVTTGAVLAAAMAAAMAPGTAGAKEREGVEPAVGIPFAVRRGFFLETQVGVFTAFGGSKTASNAQPFVGFSLGMDLSKTTQGATVFLSGGYGSNAGSCRDFASATGGKAAAGTDPDGGCFFYPRASSTATTPQTTTGESPKDFNVIPIEVGLRFAFGELAALPVNPYVGLVAGYTFLTPKVTDAAGMGSPHAGLGGGLEYQTRLEGLTIGVEALVRVAFSPMIPSLTAYPRIRYVF